MPIHQYVGSLFGAKAPRFAGRFRKCCALCNVALDSGQEGLGVGAHDLGNLVAALEQQECRHGADTEFLGDIGDFVDVDLEEACVGELFGEPSRMSKPRFLMLGKLMRRLT